MIQPRVAESFAKQGMMISLGAQLVDADQGNCTIRAPLLPGFTQQHGYTHAGVTFAIGDSAAGYAALSSLPEGAEVLTAEMKINLLAPARGSQLTAKGRVLKAGRRIVVVSSEVWSDDVLIAVMQGTMIPV